MNRIETIAEGVTLYLGDCREIAPSLPKKAAVVSDPPYGMDYNTNSKRFTGGKDPEIRRVAGRDDRTIEGDSEPFDPSPWLNFDECILWGSHHYAARLPIGITLVWLKKYPAQYGTFLSDAEIGWQKGGHGVYVFNAPDSPARRRMEFTGSAMGKETAHPFQKPVALMKWCVERTKSDLVIDPYMGSGTTGIAAILQRRRFIGVEKDPTYFEIAVKRIGDELLKPDMFVEKPKPIETPTTQVTWDEMWTKPFPKTAAD